MSEIKNPPNTTETPVAPLRPVRPSLVTRNIRLGLMRTSVRLEQQEWQALEHICLLEGLDRHGFAARVQADPARRENTLTSRLRCAILAYCMKAAGFGGSSLGSHYPRAINSNSGKVANETRVETTTRPATAVASRA